MRNGSLLISKTRTADAGKYKCNVTNQFSTNKKLTNSPTTLVVMSRTSNDANDDRNDYDEEALLSKLQHATYKIKSGDTIELYCVSNWRGEKVRERKDAEFHHNKLINFFILLIDYMDILAT